MSRITTDSKKHINWRRPIAMEIF